MLPVVAFESVVVAVMLAVWFGVVAMYLDSFAVHLEWPESARHLHALISNDA